jgi:hypothetical protein
MSMSCAKSTRVTAGSVSTVAPFARRRPTDSTSTE